MVATLMGTSPLPQAGRVGLEFQKGFPIGSGYVFLQYLQVALGEALGIEFFDFCRRAEIRFTEIVRKLRTTCWLSPRVAF